MDQDASAEILILGTGAMATLLAAHLARAGAEVSMAGTWAEAIDQIRSAGPAVEEASGSWSARARAMPIGELRGQFDLVIVLVKSYRTADVAAVAARSRPFEGLVLTLQNGLGNEDLLAAAAGAGNVAVGTTSFGATSIGPGRVRLCGRGETSLACRSCGAARLGRLVRLMDAAGLAASRAPGVDRLVWRKLAVSAAINAPSALWQVPNGQLLVRSGLRAMLEAAASEVGCVAAARGVDLGADPVALAVEVAERTADNRSSMLQDLARGARTEIDALNGAVVAEGQRLDVPTPVNEMLWRQVRLREGRPVTAGRMEALDQGQPAARDMASDAD